MRQIISYETTARVAAAVLSAAARLLARVADFAGRPDAGDDLRYVAEYGRGRYGGSIFFAAPATATVTRASARAAA